jgi:hypothetical protein
MHILRLFYTCGMELDDVTRGDEMTGYKLTRYKINKGQNDRDEMTGYKMTKGRNDRGRNERGRIVGKPKK